MFTGLVQAMGEVLAVRPRGGELGEAGSARILVDTRGWDPRAQIGDSIAIDGCCLTVVEMERSPGGEGKVGGGHLLTFDAVAETLAKTTLGLLEAGLRVNLERSLALGELMGGHMVQGHVEGVGEVASVSRGDDYRLVVEVPTSSSTLMAAIVPKGSVTINGVSLTVAEVDVAAARFTVALIPTTLELTTLGLLREGSRVNLETDVVARTVVHWLEHFGDKR